MRPGFIKHCEELRTEVTFSYPGDSETFGTGAALGRKLGLSRVAINYEVLEPGDRTSWPHAHKEAEEFILEGSPQIWIDGHIYDLAPGDCVGLPPGAGHAHTLLNNSKSKVKALVMGDTHVSTDKILYPLHPARDDEMKEKGVFWDIHPENKMGEHDGQTDIKRGMK